MTGGVSSMGTGCPKTRRPLGAAERERSAAIIAGVLGVLGPVLMVFSNQSIHLVGPIGLTAAALLVRVHDGPGKSFPVSRGLSVEGLLLVLAVAWMSLSLIWTLAPSLGARTVLQVAAIAATGWIGLFAAPNLLRPKAALYLVAGLAIAAALVFAELLLDSPIRSLFTQELGDFRYNRTLDTAVLLVWPAALYLALTGKTSLAVLLVGLVGIALLPSNAGAASIGYVVGVAALAFALVGGRLAVWVMAIAVLVIVACTPWLTLHLHGLMPDSVHEALASTHSRIRGEIWRWHGAAYQLHWFRGWGISATRDLAGAPELASFPQEARELMKGHLHPHNAVFQVWSELGLPGAILLGGLLASLLRRIAALRRWSQAFALAAFSAGFVIAYVSHGAWQAWWLAAIALTIAWFAVVVPAEREIPPTAEVR